MPEDKKISSADNQGDLVIYQSDDGETKIDVRFVDETVWLTQQQLCDLYQTSKSNISEHIKHIFEEEELEENSVVRKFRTTASDGKKYLTTYYNLDMIISLGYRIKSKIATNFRRWASERLKEYMIKGFTMDDERLKQLGGGNYWHELLDRIAIFVLQKKSCIVKCWIYMSQAWTITQKAENHLRSSSWYKTSYIMQLTVTQLLKLFMNAPMRINLLWALLLFPAIFQQQKTRILLKIIYQKMS